MESFGGGGGRDSDLLETAEKEKRKERGETRVKINP